MPLLSQEFRPVPGSATTTTTYVRSNHTQVANLAIFVDQATSPSDVLLEATTISGAHASVRSLTSVDRCLPLQSARIAPGQTLPVTVTMRVAPSMTGAQLTPLQIKMTALMSDTSVAPQPTGCDGETDGARAALAVTGLDTAQLWPLLGMGAAGVVGGALLARQRKVKDAV